MPDVAIGASVENLRQWNLEELDRLRAENAVLVEAVRLKGVPSVPSTHRDNGIGGARAPRKTTRAVPTTRR